MSFWLTVAGMLAVTFGSRLAGLGLRAQLPPFWLRFLHFVPIAVFAALFEPIAAIALAGGPMNARPAFAQAAANSAFSDRKP